MKAKLLHWISVETPGGAASENNQYSDCAATANPEDGAAGWPFEACTGKNWPLPERIHPPVFEHYLCPY